MLCLSPYLMSPDKLWGHADSLHAAEMSQLEQAESPGRALPGRDAPFRLIQCLIRVRKVHVDGLVCQVFTLQLGRAHLDNRGAPL